MWLKAIHVPPATLVRQKRKNASYDGIGQVGRMCFFVAGFDALVIIVSLRIPPTQRCPQTS